MNRNVATVLLVVGTAALCAGIWVVWTAGGEPEDTPSEPPREGSIGPEGEDISDWHPGHEPLDPPPPPPPAVEPDPPAESPPSEPETPAAKPADPEAEAAKMRARLDGTTFTLEVNDLEVSAALGLVARLAGVEIDSSQADAHKLAKKISFSFDGAGVVDAIEFICQMTGLEHDVDGKGIVIR